MVATERFYPKGFIGSEDAILRIAKIRDPSRWTPDKILPDEQAVWHELGKTLNATYIRNHLGVLDKGERQRAGDTSMIDRLYDFSEALVELRKALFAGEIVAYFVDERGKQDFIAKEGWGGDEGANILLLGVVDLVDGWRRLILLKTEDIDLLAKSLPAVSPYEEEGRATTRDRARPRPAVEIPTVVSTDADGAEFYSMVSVPGKQHEWIFRAMAETWKDHRVPRKTIAEIEIIIAPEFRRISGKKVGSPGLDNIRRILVWNGRPLKAYERPLKK